MHCIFQSFFFCCCPPQHVLPYVAGAIGSYSICTLLWCLFRNTSLLKKNIFRSLICFVVNDFPIALVHRVPPSVVELTGPSRLGEPIFPSDRSLAQSLGLFKSPFTSRSIVMVCRLYTKREGSRLCRFGMFSTSLHENSKKHKLMSYNFLEIFELRQDTEGLDLRHTCTWNYCKRNGDWDFCNLPAGSLSSPEEIWEVSGWIRQLTGQCPIV